MDWLFRDKDVDALGSYLRNLKGISCTGDINVGGTFKINGVPLTAFRPVPERVIEKTIEPRIIERVIERPSGGSHWGIEAGDNIVIDRLENKIHADPGDWQEYTPKIVDAGNVMLRIKALGQYIIFGPICTIQLHVEEHDGLVKVDLPYASYGPVRQSLNGHEIVGSQIIFDDPKNRFASGSYRIA
jgi:hypothetical protein